VEMVKGQDEKCTQANQLLQTSKTIWETCQQNMKACKV
jgi:hypothetical protein